MDLELLLASLSVSVAAFPNDSGMTAARSLIPASLTELGPPMLMNPLCSFRGGTKRGQGQICIALADGAGGASKRLPEGARSLTDLHCSAPVP